MLGIQISQQWLVLSPSWFITAIEGLKLGLWSCASDVWSLGILAWMVRVMQHYWLPPILPQLNLNENSDYIKCHDSVLTQHHPPRLAHKARHVEFAFSLQLYADSSNPYNTYHRPKRCGSTVVWGTQTRCSGKDARTDAASGRRHPLIVPRPTALSPPGNSWPARFLPIYGTFSVLECSPGLSSAVIFRVVYITRWTVNLHGWLVDRNWLEQQLTLQIKGIDSLFSKRCCTVCYSNQLHLSSRS